MTACIAQELHDLDAHLGCAVVFLLGTQGGCFTGVDSVDAGLAVRGQQVAERLGLLHSTVDRSGQAVLEIITVGYHAQGS